jgi:class 3 adenylate cyclase
MSSLPLPNGGWLTGYPYRAKWKTSAATAEGTTDNFHKWAGEAAVATVAIVFTDICDSTKLNGQLGDERWSQVREQHFTRAKRLIERERGYLIKTIGDSIMAAFHSASHALDFALTLEQDTGQEIVKIRAGIHVGPVEVKPGDAFGQQVNMAARVEVKAKEGGVWVSAQVKEDIDSLRAERHENLKWIEHPNQDLKGFPRLWTLWSVEQLFGHRAERVPNSQAVITGQGQQATSLFQRGEIMEKIRVLFLAADPGVTNQLHLDREVREIETKIRASMFRDSLELISKWAVQPDDLQQSLLDHQPHIVHFSGHGSEANELGSVSQFRFLVQ